MEDLKGFGLDFLELNEMKSMENNEFKKIVKEKCKEVAIKNLLEDNDKSKLKILHIIS